MKIKDAAKYCGLTEKAIRLYENKGLISPPTEDKNGRTFRDYDDHTIRNLISIGTLRRASFSLEQIGSMQNHPELIPEILEDYRVELRSNAHRLALLCEIMDNINVDEHCGIDSIAKYISCSALSVNNTMSADTSEEKPLNVPVPKEFRWTVWDEDISEESKEKALKLFWEQFEKRERRRDIALLVPRTFAKIWNAVPKVIKITVLCGIAAICIIGLILYNAKTMTPYTLTLEGVEYFREENDPNIKGTVGDSVTITFEGELHNYLIKEDYFTGKMTIDGYELYQPFAQPYSRPEMIPATEITVDSFFSNSRLYYNRFLTYFPDFKMYPEYIKGTYELERRNIFVMNFDDPDNVIIMIPIKEEIPNDDTNADVKSANMKRVGYIITPAKNELDAEYLFRKVMEEYNSLFWSNLKK